MSERAAGQVRLTALRPPTYERLSRTLRNADAEGQPFHIVHFDGHGVYGEWKQFERQIQERQVIFPDRRPGKHGYLVFESPAAEYNMEVVDGTRIGSLLTDTRVPVLVLNSCDSARVDGDDDSDDQPAAGGQNAEVRAFGSLAQEVLDMGVPGVVAMRNLVYVPTAAQFIADLYAACCQGQTLGEAVTSSRKLLHDQPQRTLGIIPSPENSRTPIPRIMSIGQDRLGVGITPGA